MRAEASARGRAPQDAEDARKHARTHTRASPSPPPPPPPRALPDDRPEAAGARAPASARLLHDMQGALRRAQCTEAAVAAGFAPTDALASLFALVLGDMKEVLRAWADANAPAPATLQAPPLEACDAGEQLLFGAQTALSNVHGELQSVVQQGSCSAARLAHVKEGLEALVARLAELRTHYMASAAQAKLLAGQLDAAQGRVQDLLGRDAEQRQELLDARRRVRETQLELVRQREKHEEALRTEEHRCSNAHQERMSFCTAAHEREKELMRREADGHLAAMRRMCGREISHYESRELEELKEEMKQAYSRVEQVVALREAECKVAKAMHSLVCPITCSLMRDPVQAADGITYEREDIEKWLRASDISPKTLLPLPNKTLVVNYAIKGCIDEAVQAKLKQMASKKDGERLAGAKRPFRE